MTTSRRKFLKDAASFGTLATAGAAVGCSTSSSAPPPATTTRSLGRGLATGLTLLTFRQGGENRLGVKTDKGVLDVPRAASLLKMYAPATLDDLLQNEDGPSLNALVEASLRSADASPSFHEEGSIDYGPLVSRPEKIVCVGLNYRKHAEEVGQPIPMYPVLFSKFNNTLNRHKGTVKLPTDLATQFDYEVELVMVMGKTASRVSEADALTYVAGYTTGNDFTARDLQNGRGTQWLTGKTPDQFAPIGPHLVTADQVDPDKLTIECRVNGEVRQSSNTADFIFNTRKQISYISQFITLKPGDIIFTGTPEGVIQGKPKDQQVWLKPGDRIACSLEKLGELTFDLV